MPFNSSFSVMKDKYVSWIPESFSTLKTFRNYVENRNLGKIISLNDAYEHSPSKPYVILVSLNKIFFYIVCINFFNMVDILQF